VKKLFILENKIMLQITLNNQKITFQKKYSKRAKSIRISINNSGELVLTLPKPGFFQSSESIEKKALEFLKSKEDWVIKHINQQSTSTASKSPDLVNYSREHYLKYKEIARILCEEKCELRATKMGVQYNRITIKSMKTRWGSCSSKKNLNFNYKILFLSEKDRNYLIVHELSHLIHMNHSSKFWDFVCETLGNEEFRRYKMLVD
jgi:predicted metal-dependent hydrolase